MNHSRIRYKILFGTANGTASTEIETTIQGAKLLATKLYREHNGIINEEYPRIHLLMYNPRINDYELKFINYCGDKRISSHNKWMTIDECQKNTGSISLYRYK